MINQDLIDKIAYSYLHPENSNDSGLEACKKSIIQLAEEYGMTPSKVKKILITAGVFSNEESKQVQALFEAGKSIPDIVKITGLSKSSVNSYLPYSKGIYNDNTKEQSLENIRVKKHRENKITIVNPMHMDTLELKKHVVFYSVNDLGIAFHLDAVKCSLLNKNSIKTLRDAIHFYNCYLYIENRVFGRDWTENELAVIIDNAKYYKSEVARYLTTNPYCILNEFDGLEYDYKNCAMRMAAFFNTYRKWIRGQFKSCLTEDMVRSILKVERLVQFFDHELTEFLCDNVSFTTEMLVTDNSIPIVETINKIFFPKKLTNKKKKEILEEYVYSENPRVENLVNIIYMPNDIGISDKAKADAQRIIDAYYKKNLESKNNSLYTTTIGVAFVPYETWRNNRTNRTSSNYIMEYPQEIIDQYLNPQGVFHCLKYMFGLFDIQSIQVMPAKKSHKLSIVDDLLGIKTKFGYNLQQNQSTQMLFIQGTMLVYYDYLRNHNIMLETVLGDDFSKIMREKYGVEGFDYNLPVGDSSFEEKCVVICPKIERLFDLVYLLGKGEPIDQYSIRGCPEVRFSLIDSLLSDKYLYVNEDERIRNVVSNVSALLFSSVNTFSIDRFQNQDSKITNNFELLLQNNISKDEIHDWDKGPVDYLIKNNCIIEIKSCLKLSKNVLLLKELWDNGCISTYKTPCEIKVLRSLLASGWLEKENTLLSRPEQDFLSFLYGNSKYSDALALRNAYAHGDVIGVSEEKHKINYMWLLFIVIVLEIKILDELETIESLRLTENNCIKDNDN